MARRGLDTARDYLFALDGSKALRSAVAKMFGADAMVQRCQMHKRRNVKAQLPQKRQNGIDARIRAAYKMAKYDDAKKSLDLTVRYLERLNPDAARSLKEGLEETLTPHKLSVTGLLRKTLSTTNPIESCFSVTRTITGRVKRWRGGDMLQRWAVAALLRAEKKFRRVQGYREIAKLLAALQNKSLDRKEVAALNSAFGVLPTSTKGRDNVSVQANIIYKEVIRCCEKHYIHCLFLFWVQFLLSAQEMQDQEEDSVAAPRYNQGYFTLLLVNSLRWVLMTGGITTKPISFMDGIVTSEEVNLVGGMHIVMCN